MVVVSGSVVNKYLSTQSKCCILEIAGLYEYHNNQYFSLDFTNEPGIVNFNGKELPEDPHWKELPGPLNLEINFFEKKEF